MTLQEALKQTGLARLIESASSGGYAKKEWQAASNEDGSIFLRRIPYYETMPEHVEVLRDYTAKDIEAIADTFPFLNKSSQWEAVTTFMR